MKILKLSIRKFRGIIELDLDLNGKNAVIVGPNGVGKSAVVDAIDFLFTGNITRLSGEGSGSLNVIKHGPHVGYDPKEAKVTALIQISNKRIFEVTRTIAQKDNIQIEKEYESEFERITKYAKNGAHILSRREILKFILVTPSDRSKQIQALLDISGLKIIRDAFTKLKSKVTKEAELAEDNNKTYLKTLLKKLNVKDRNEILNEINTQRSKLGGSPLSSLNENFLIDLTYNIDESSVEITSYINKLKDIIDYLPELSTKINEANIKIKRIINELLIENVTTTDINLNKLLYYGIELLNGNGRCPLCLKPWPSEEELRKFLLFRKKQNEAISKLIESFNVELKAILNFSKEYSSKLDIRTDVLKKYIQGNIDVIIEEQRNLIELQNLTTLNIENYIENSKILDFYINENQIKEITIRLKVIVQELNLLVDGKSKEQSESWNLLNEAQSYYSNIRNYEILKPKQDLMVRKASILLEQYENVQELILNEMFLSISDRFAYLYKIMHSGDEDTFTATIENSGAGVSMNVDFYGRGKFPPMAFHSEGHQDSMGIALFFALMEQLSTFDSGVIVLDDVVMSVDIGHRKNFCNILKETFSNIQFIITTHDNIWSRYLRSENIMPDKNYISFSNWDIDTGPIANIGNDIWKTVRDKAEVNLNDAAAFFRREMECFFETICDKLSADLPYNSENKHDCGEYMNAAYSSLKHYYQKARDLTKAVESEDKQKNLNERYADVNKENWITNKLVHFNPEEFTKSEFLSLVKKMEVFCKCFGCQDCGALLKVVYGGSKPKFLTCSCGKHLLTFSK